MLAWTLSVGFAMKVGNASGFLYPSRYKIDCRCVSDDIEFIVKERPWGRLTSFPQGMEGTYAHYDDTLQRAWRATSQTGHPLSQAGRVERRVTARCPAPPLREDRVAGYHQRDGRCSCIGGGQRPHHAGRFGPVRREPDRGTTARATGPEEGGGPGRYGPGHVGPRGAGCQLCCVPGINHKLLVGPKRNLWYN
jgi:hypothetical protein